MRFFTIPHVRTIRSRLFLYFVCLIGVTAGAISGVTVLLESRDARDRVFAQLKSVATLKEQEVDSWLNGLNLNLDIVLSAENIAVDLRTLTLPARGTEAYNAAYSRVLKHFSWASNRMGLFEELFFMGDKGQVLLSTTRSHENQKLGLNDYFLRGMKGEFIQEPSYSLSLGRMIVVASCPVRYQGVSLGVLAGRANLRSLNDAMIGRAGLGETGETFLVGSNHRLLTDLRRPGYSIPDTYVRTYGADAAVDQEQNGSATYRSYAGEAVIGVYRWMPRLQVALIAEQGEAEALQTTRLALWTTGGVAALATVFAILAGIVLTRGIVRPLSELGNTAGRITAGELDLTARVARRDEIGNLADSFNRMTSQLRGLVTSLEKRTHHLRAINDAGRGISSILDLNELLPYVARSLLQTFDYEMVRILLLVEDDKARLLSCGRDSCEETLELRRDNLSQLPAVVASVLQTETPVLQKLMSSVEAEIRTTTTHGITEQGEDQGSEIAVPIRIGQSLAGVLNITSHSTHPLDEQDLFAAQTLADQLAIAVENSRLYEHAHELAASRERQRLAHDLHDAVSQTLFSVSLIAEVLPRIYERDVTQGTQRLEELRQLTRGALAEMRTLLLELRPTALSEADLPDLLRQLGEAVTGRSRIPVEVQVSMSLGVSSEVRVALYRIAQEALNNVAKHSRAERARVILREITDDEGQALELIVEDEGGGFDVGEGRSGRLGLGIMAERAAAIGARLEVKSRPGEGTCIRVVWHRQPTPAAGAGSGTASR